MAVRYDDKRITLFGDSVLYDPYYFDIAAEGKSLDYLGVVRRVLGQWAEALAQARPGGPAVYLPFGLYDECMECFLATLRDDLVTLRCIWVSTHGYAVDLLNLSEFMAGPQEVIQQSQEDFGIYPRAELVRALAGAEQAAA